MCGARLCSAEEEKQWKKRVFFFFFLERQVKIEEVNERTLIAADSFSGWELQVSLAATDKDQTASRHTDTHLIFLNKMVFNPLTAPGFLEVPNSPTREKRQMTVALDAIVTSGD